MCDKGFNDYSAKLVCQDLGFDDGKSISGSAYGKIYEDILENKTLSCGEDSRTIDSCLHEGPCNESDFYASAACFKKIDLPLKEGLLTMNYEAHIVGLNEIYIISVVWIKKEKEMFMTIQKLETNIILV